jgi:hypothetical protein
MSRVKFENLATWGTFFGGIGTIIAVFFLVQQVQIMQTDSDVNNRPWLGGFNFYVSDIDVKYDYENDGKVPNTGGTFSYYVSDTEITRDTFSKNGNTTPLMSIMPSQSIFRTFSGDIMNKIQNVKQGKGDCYLGISIQYEYGNKKSGEYNLIAKYEPKYNTFSILDTWVK